MKGLAILPVVALVGGCSVFQQKTAVDPLVACTSYEGVLATVNDVLESGELSDDQVVAFGGRVQQVNTVVLPLCTGDTLPETNSTAAVLILTGLTDLVAIQTEMEN